jgi:hypothetical protein
MQEYVDSDCGFDLNPVDMVARASLLLSLHSVSKTLRVYHLVDACKSSNREVGLAAAGEAGRAISFPEFKASLTCKLQSGDASNGAESLRPFMSFFETDAFFTELKHHKSCATVAALQQLGMDWQFDGAACVRGVVSFLLQRPREMVQGD